MRLYTFYHVPGIKVGCTINFVRREKAIRSKGYTGDIFILAIKEFETEQEAGDYEFLLADQYGYPRGNYYANAVTNRRFGGAKAGFQLMTSEQHSEYGRLGAQRAVALGRTGFQTMTSEQHSAAGKLGAKLGGHRGGTRTSQLGKNPFQTGVASKAAIASPNHASKLIVTCPYCGITGKALPIKRWHFNNCRKKPQ